MNNLIVKNVIFNMLSKLVNMIFPLVSSIYVSHVIFAEGVGKVGYAQNISQYFILLAPLGIVNYGTRELAKVRYYKNQINILFSELFFINLFSTIFFASFYYGMIFLCPYFSDERSLFIVTGIPIIFNVFNVEWFYQGMEEYVYISVRNIIVKMISFVCIIIFVRSTQDCVAFALIYSVGIVGNYLLNIKNIVKYKIKLIIKGIHPLKHIRLIIVFLSSSIAIELYTLLDTTMLGYFCDDTIVGYYTNAVKLDKVTVGLIASIGTVLLPRLSLYVKNGEIKKINLLITRVIMIITFLVIPAGIGVFVIANKLTVLLFGPSFVPAILTVQIGTALIYILAFSNLFGTQILLAFNQEKKMFIGTGIGAITNFIMNYFLIPRYQHNGAMIASVVSEIIVVILFIYMMFAYIKITINFRFLFKSLLSGGIMGLIVSIINYSIESLIVSIIFSIVFGIIVYLSIGVLIKNPIIDLIKSRDVNQ